MKLHWHNISRTDRFSNKRYYYCNKCGKYIRTKPYWKLILIPVAIGMIFLHNSRMYDYIVEITGLSMLCGILWVVIASGCVLLLDEITGRLSCFTNEYNEPPEE